MLTKFWYLCFLVIATWVLEILIHKIKGAIGEKSDAFSYQALIKQSVI
ncbi:hypothetical protein [Clostridium psychrophilum]|nr:hypothetical protein [Clostridium psychrophilum]MBU3182900.1 hypothetical protein [Clostridium psychrophilum]